MRWAALLAVSITLAGVGAGSPSGQDALARAGRAHAAPPRERQTAPEQLRYQALWNGVPVARAELSITPSSRRNGGAVDLAGRAETNEALDLLWRMRDGFEATVATSPPAPSRFLLRQHENERRRETSITADPARRVLVGSKKKHGRAARVSTVPLARDVHDPASLAYLIRTRGPELHARETYRVFTGTKTNEVTVTPAGDETIVVIGRSWRTRKLHLALRLDDSKTGGMPPRIQEADLWISSGPERLPLRLQGSTDWGWVVIELVGRGAAPRNADATWS